MATFEEILEDIRDTLKGVREDDTAVAVHKSAKKLVRGIIMSVSLFSLLLMLLSMVSYDFAVVAVPFVTIVAMGIIIWLLTSRWSDVVTGLVELGIITAGLSSIELKKLKAVSAIAGVVKDFGAAAFRWAMKVVGFLLLVGVYFSIVPVANERRLALLVALLMFATVSLSLGKVKKLTWIPIVLLYMVTVVFFNGGIDESIRKYEERQANAQTTSVVRQSRQTETIRYLVELKGNDILSDVAVVMEDIPPGVTCPFEGPISTQVHFDDGTVGFITESYGVKSGPVRFTGPEGEMAGLVCSI